jgi:diadenosine tetraphosphate (Ap4A) HIT family hydrolase
MNYLTLGNAVPHLHSHIVPRPVIDPAPRGPLPFRYLDEGRQPEAEVQVNAERVRRALAEPA